MIFKIDLRCSHKKLTPYIKGASFLFMLLGFASCVATTTDIDQLAGTLDRMQRTQADLTIKMDELDRSLGILNENLTQNQTMMGELSQKLENTQANLTSRMGLITELLSAATAQSSVIVPGEVYRGAYEDYLAGKLSLAINGFDLFLKRYP